MEVKKSKKADLENRRGLFMEIGLIVALAAVIIMFSVSQREKSGRSDGTRCDGR